VAGAGSLQTFVNGGQPGETLCIQGAFAGNLTLSRSGFTLRNVPGQQASLSGGSGFTLVAITGDDLMLYGLDVSGGNARNCLLLGAGGESNAANVVNNLTLDHMRIHDCGDDNHEHAVYAEFTNDLHIVDSYLYASGGYGLHFYPEANGSLVEHSLIDGNDTGTGYAGNVVFSGEAAGGEYAQAHTSDRNVVRDSLMTFASPGENTRNVDSYSPTGANQLLGNEVAFNCVYSPSDTAFSFDHAGDYAQYSNLTADPRYVDRTAGNFTLQPDSPCVGKGPR
jgi:hypothetical protein